MRIPKWSQTGTHSVELEPIFQGARAHWLGVYRYESRTAEEAVRDPEQDWRGGEGGEAEPVE